MNRITSWPELSELTVSGCFFARVLTAIDREFPTLLRVFVVGGDNGQHGRLREPGPEDWRRFALDTTANAFRGTPRRREPGPGDILLAA